MDLPQHRRARGCVASFSSAAHLFGLFAQGMWEIEVRERRCGQICGDLLIFCPGTGGGGGFWLMFALIETTVSIDVYTWKSGQVVHTQLDTVEVLMPERVKSISVTEHGIACLMPSLLGIERYAYHSYIWTLIIQP